MIVILLVLGLLVLVAIPVALVRAVASDGFGTLPPPRSHHEEVGSWSTQELSR